MMRRGWVKISWTDRVADEEMLQRVKEERNIIHTIKRVDLIGHILRRNCLLEHVIEGKIEGILKLRDRGDEDLSGYWMTLRKVNDRDIKIRNTRSQGQWAYHKTDFEMKEGTIFESVRVCRFCSHSCSLLLCRRNGKLVLLFVRI